MARGECEAQMSERDSLAELADPMVNTVHCQHLRSRNVNMGENEPQTPPPNPRAADGALRSLWFTGPMGDEDRRQPLTRERVLAQALTIIAKEGVEALTMRNLAACLGVVPGALYRHVRSKEQLQDLVLDGVLAEVDCDVDPSLPCTEQIKVLAHRLRAVLEDHPGVAGLLKIRDPRQAGGSGVLPRHRLHRRLCGEQSPHLSERAASPRHGHAQAAPRVLPLASRRPLSHPGRPRRARLARQPRRTFCRWPRSAGRRAAAGPARAAPTQPVGWSVKLSPPGWLSAARTSGGSGSRLLGYCRITMQVRVRVTPATTWTLATTSLPSSSSPGAWTLAMTS